MVVGSPIAERVGVPRSILHYEFDGAIERFLRYLGVDVLLSPETHRDIFLAGKRIVLDEVCFPVKVYAGHVAHLVAQGVNRVVIPVVVGHENDSVFPCHVQTRLADIVRSLGVCDESQILAPSFRFDCDGLSVEGFRELAGSFGISSAACDRALRASRPEPLPEPRGSRGRPGQVTVGLVGRPYVIRDAWANNGIVERMRRAGCLVRTERDIPRLGYAPEGTGLHFALAARTLVLASAFDQSPRVDGLVFLLPFNCGPDGDIARHLVRITRTPMMTLVLDELQSSAGLVTRIEAFVDLLRRRRAATAEGVS